MKQICILLYLISLSCLGELNAQPYIIAHRGFWNVEGISQNSLASLRQAAEAACWGSEFDVWMTLDSVLVVNHDGKIGNYDIQNVNYADIRNLKLSNGEILPTLKEYLLVGKNYPDLKLILELKSHKNSAQENEAAKKIVDMVADLGLKRQVEYISFSLNACKQLIHLDPTAKVAYLNGDLSPQQVKEIGLTGIDYYWEIIQNHPYWVKDAQALGLSVNVWTVNSPKEQEYMIRLGVDYITTDCPLDVRKLLKDK